MKRICLVGLTALVFMFSTAHAQNLNVQQISDDRSEAVLLDRDTGITWSVTNDDKIGEWTVIKIDEFGVTIKQDAKEGAPFAIVRKLPLMSKHGFSPGP